MLRCYRYLHSAQLHIATADYNVEFFGRPSHPSIVESLWWRESFSVRPLDKWACTHITVYVRLYLYFVQPKADVSAIAGTEQSALNGALRAERVLVWSFFLILPFLLLVLLFVCCAYWWILLAVLAGYVNRISGDVPYHCLYIVTVYLYVYSSWWLVTTLRKCSDQGKRK